MLYCVNEKNCLECPTYPTLCFHCQLCNKRAKARNNPGKGCSRCKCQPTLIETPPYTDHNEPTVWHSVSDKKPPYNTLILMTDGEYSGLFKLRQEIKPPHWYLTEEDSTIEYYERIQDTCPCCEDMAVNYYPYWAYVTLPTKGK